MFLNVLKDLIDVKGLLFREMSRAADHDEEGFGAREHDPRALFAMKKTKCRSRIAMRVIADQAYHHNIRLPPLETVDGKRPVAQVACMWIEPVIPIIEHLIDLMNL